MGRYFNILIIIGLLFLLVVRCSQEKEENWKNQLFAFIESDEINPSLITLNYQFISSLQGVKHCIPSQSILYDDILQIPGFTENVAESIESNFENPQTLLHIPFRLLGASAGGFGPPVTVSENVSKKNSNEEEFLLKLKADYNFQFKAKSRTDWEKLPAEFRIEVLKSILVIGNSVSVLKQFAKPIIEKCRISNQADISSLYKMLSQPWTNRQLIHFESIDCISYADLSKLSFASRLVCEQVQKLSQKIPDSVDSSFSKCIIRTNFGEVEILGLKNDTISSNNCLTIDLGGDDSYFGSIATSCISTPVSIVIDKKGDDTYNGTEGYLALGLLGVSMVFDLDGNDFYYSNNPGISAALYGTSLILDAEGNDKYSSPSEYTMASAIIGASLLVDLNGDDKYFSSNYSQGFGSTLGVGVLIDNRGTDCYAKNPEIENSLSFVQGAAKGRWAEATDGQSLGGGYGFLFDFSGDDIYIANSFAQGAAYYFGIGALYDKCGNDSYSSSSHSQGYAAHFALANLSEVSGNDVFNVNCNKNNISQIIGGGRDFSAGLFFDFNGNDSYTFGNRSVGIGDLNGIGIMCDLLGDDTYTWVKNTMNHGSLSLGKTIEPEKNVNIDFRLFELTSHFDFGFFYDINGEDKFYDIEE